MTSFRFDIGPRRRKVARFIGQVRNELVRALVEEKEENKFSQNQLAKKLDVDRSVINRQLNGEANLTLRSVAELAWALDRDIVFELRKPNRGGNFFSEVATGPSGISQLGPDTQLHGASTEPFSRKNGIEIHEESF